ncbi:hypothetical protein Ahy_A01g002783 [Arachis hypogaea]|uniref:SWIM-type domain-containing protein n=1 Tax=Arachis hypogaea TaxID=3818 RepID=A0A445ERE0_ARAHY|nr:hypothetical protein Ahy_A01g002783 [Arachis hypogaea]
MQETKKVKKIYYRYPTEIDAVFLVDLGGRGSSADTVDGSPLSGPVRRNIRQTMVDLNMPPKGSQEGSNVGADNAELDDGAESHDGSAVGDPMMDQYEANPDDGDDAEEEPAEIPNDGDDEEEMNFYVEVLAAVPGFRQQNYQVLLDEGNCDCGYFQELHLPCRYILAACSQARIDWKGFVHPLYRMDSIFNVYKRRTTRWTGHQHVVDGRLTEEEMCAFGRMVVPDVDVS